MSYKYYKCQPTIDTRVLEKNDAVLALGKLFLPRANTETGKCYIPLNLLYSLVFSKKSEGNLGLNHDDVLAIAIFGSSIAPKHKTIIKQRKKYFFFGKAVTLKKEYKICGMM